MHRWQPKQSIVLHIDGVLTAGRRQIVHGRQHLTDGLASGRDWLHVPESWHAHFEHGQAQALQMASAVALVAGCTTSQPLHPDTAAAGGPGGSGSGGELAPAGEMHDPAREAREEAERRALRWWWTDPTLDDHDGSPGADEGPGAIEPSPADAGVATPAADERAGGDPAPDGGVPDEGGYAPRAPHGASAPPGQTTPAAASFGEAATGDGFTGPWYTTGF